MSTFVLFHLYSITGIFNFFVGLITFTTLGITPPDLIICKTAPGPIILSTINFALLPVILLTITPSICVSSIIIVGLML